MKHGLAKPSISPFAFLIAFLAIAPLAALAQSPGTIRWAFPTGSTINRCPAIGANGLVYAGTSDGKVYAINAASGQKEWETIVPSPVDGIAIGPDGTVYVGTAGQFLYALDPATGQEKWHFTGEPGLFASPSIGHDGTVYFGADVIYAVNPATGAELWQAAHIRPGTALSLALGDLLFCGGNDGKIMALDTTSHLRYWTVPASNFFNFSAAIGSNGTVYIGSTESNLCAFDGITGELLWRFQTDAVYPPNVRVDSSPIIGPDGTVYIYKSVYVSDPKDPDFEYPTGMLYALNGATGQKRWERPLPYWELPMPAVAADGTVYLATSYELYAFNGQTGTTNWILAQGAVSPINVGPDGTVYFGSSALYAVHGASPLADSPWPKFQQNAQNTGLWRVSGPPQITRQPHSRWAAVDSATTFRFHAPVARPLHIQWLFNSQPITGATNEALHFDRVSFADAGPYSVTLSNSLGSTTSHEAELWVGYSIEVTTVGPGTVQRSLDQAAYPTGSVVRLTAVGAEGAWGWPDRRFLGWSGDITSTNNPLDITLTSNVTLIASFQYFPGDVKWQSQFSDVAALGSNGVLYAFKDGVTIIAIDANTGRTVWEVGAGDGWWAPPAIGPDGTIYIGDYPSDGMFALDPATGARKGGFNVGVCVHSCTTIGPDGTLYFAGLKIYAVEPGTFREKWSFEGGKTFDSSPALGPNGILYAGCHDGKMYALNAATGTKLWEFATGDGTQGIHSSPALGADDAVFFGSYDGKVYALEGGSGLKRWEFTAGGPVGGSPVIGPDGTVYISADDAKVYALDGQTGQKKWEFLSHYPIQGAGAVTADGTLYIGSYALSTVTGERLWGFNPGYQALGFASPYRASPNVGPDGTIYYGGAAIQGTSPLAASSWPKFHQNPENTGHRRISGPPELTGQPASHMAALNRPTSFHFSTPVARPLAVQWYFNGEPIPGATNEALRFDSVQFSDAGSYSVVVSNAFGRVVSQEADLSVGYALDLVTIGPGSVQRDPDLEIFGPFDIVQLTPVAQSPRRFLGWDGDASGSDIPLTLTLTTNLQVIARFEYLPGDRKWVRSPWSAGKGTANLTYAPALGANRTLYFPNWSHVHAVDSLTGQEKWRFTVGQHISSSVALGPDGTVYFGAWDAKVYALDGATGQKRWDFNAKRDVSHSPAVAVDGTVYVIAGTNAYALDGRTGAKKWEAETGFHRAAPVIGPDRTVYFGVGSAFDGSLVALDGFTGHTKWQASIGELFFSSPALDSNSTVYIGAQTKVVAFNGFTGEDLWTFYLGGIPAGFGTPTLAPDGTLFATGAGKLYALNPATGQKKWDAAIPYAGSPTVGADGTIYMGGHPAKMSAYDGASGQLIWEFFGLFNACCSPLSSSFATLGPDGTLFYGTHGGQLYALHASSGLASTPWPSFREHSDNRARAHSPPIFDTARSKPSASGFDLILHTEPGDTVQLQSSSNLQSWNPLATLTNTQPPIQFTDTNAPTTRRFYRAQSP